MPERGVTASLNTGEKLAVGTPAAPTASEQAGPSLYPSPCLCPQRHAPFPCRPCAAEAADQASVGAAGAGRCGQYLRGLPGAAPLVQLSREPAAGAVQSALRRQAEV
eukprot:5722402-Pleurochrysis_carterae.AAC.1